MRFKAKLAPEQVSLLYSLVVPISRLAAAGGEGGATSWTRNGSILCLDNDHVRISCRGKSNDTNGISCFVELQALGGIFIEHRIESASDVNRIVMELDLAQLRTALQSIATYGRSYSNSAHDTAPSINSSALEQKFVEFKLAKRDNIPCLCLDSSGSGGGSVEVHHTIPVRMLKAAEMQKHYPPQIPIPDIQLELPPDKPLRAVMERMRVISPTVCLQATSRGELTITMDGDGSSIRTFFNKLTTRHEGAKEGVQDCRIKVDTKKLCASLQWQTHSTWVSSALLCFVENEMLVVHATLNPSSVGFFTYYVPVHFLTSDPSDE